MALVSLNEVKAFLGIAAEDTSKDVQIEIFRESVEQSVINYVETDFSLTENHEEILDGVRADIIVPKYFPVVQVKEVWFNVQVDGTGGYLLDGTRDYYYDQSAITLRSAHSPFRRGIIKIVYDYGYTKIPADVKHVVYQAVKSELQRFQRNTEDITSRSKGDESESYGGAWDGQSGLPKQLVSKLKPYRVYEVPNISMAQRNL